MSDYFDGDEEESAPLPVVKGTTDNVRSDHERERDLVEISALYLKGLTHFEIAEEINAKHYKASGRSVSRRQISYDVQKLLARWQKTATNNIDERRAVELAKLDRIEREAWAAWERSMSEREIPTKNGETMFITPDGDPRFLQLVQSCVADRRKMLGLDAPTKSEVSFKNMENNELIKFITQQLGSLGLSPGGNEPPGIEPQPIDPSESD